MRWTRERQSAQDLLSEMINRLDVLRLDYAILAGEVRGSGERYTTMIDQSAEMRPRPCAHTRPSAPRCVRSRQSAPRCARCMRRRAG